MGAYTTEQVTSAAASADAAAPGRNAPSVSVATHATAVLHRIRCGADEVDGSCGTDRPLVMSRLLPGREHGEKRTTIGPIAGSGGSAIDRRHWNAGLSQHLVTERVKQ